MVDVVVSAIVVGVDKLVVGVGGGVVDKLGTVVVVVIVGVGGKRCC